MAMPTLEEMLEAGVHFGHQTRRWNPKMKRFILTERNGIHVINLKKTQSSLEVAAAAVKKVAASGKGILFVGTKVTARQIIQETAEKAGQFFVTKRWVGGMLTNFATVRQSIRKLESIEKMEKDGVFKEMSKKEVLELNRDRAKLEDVFSGIRHMKQQPGLMVISDLKYEHIAVAEAHRLRIPIVALCDTNVDPDLADFPVPANDDAVKSMDLILSYLTESIVSAAPVAEAVAEEA
jgi:small subunit ribosomal protein S2